MKKRVFLFIRLLLVSSRNLFFLRLISIVSASHWILIFKRDWRYVYFRFVHENFCFISGQRFLGDDGVCNFQNLFFRFGCLHIFSLNSSASFSDWFYLWEILWMISTIKQWHAMSINLVSINQKYAFSTPIFEARKLICIASTIVPSTYCIIVPFSLKLSSFLKFLDTNNCRSLRNKNKPWNSVIPLSFSITLFWPDKSTVAVSREISTQAVV